MIQLPQIKPLHYQYGAWRADAAGKQFRILSYHRRGGKDMVDLSMLSKKAMEKRGIYHYMLPTRKWSTRVVWEAQIDIEDWTGEARSGRLLDVIFPKEIVRRMNSTDYFIELINGSVIYLGGTDGGDFVGSTSSGIVLSEFSLHKPDVLGYIMPIIKQNDAFLWLNGTMRGKDNQLYDMVHKNEHNDDWYVSWLKPTDTKLYCWCSDEFDINPEILPYINNPKYLNCQHRPFYNIQELIDSGTISMALARQEFLNDAVSDVVGAYFGHEVNTMRNDGRIGHFGGIDSRFPILTCWDIGGANQNNDSTSCVLIQETKGKHRVVGFYSKSGQGIGEDIAKIREMSGGGYFGGHWAPHDAKMTSKQTQMDLMEFCRKEYQFEFQRVRKTQSVRRDIEICRRSFVDLEFDLDGENVPRFLDLVARYREDPKTGRPDHKSDESSHAGDALRTGLMAKHYGIFTPYLHRENQMRDEFEFKDGYDDGGMYCLDT